MKLTSYTFTLEELRQMIWETAYPPAEASGNGKSILHAAQLAFETSVRSAVNTWCELCSEAWFGSHPDISDALVLLQNGEKMWMASDLPVDELKRPS